MVKEIRSYNQDEVVETFESEVVETVSTPEVFETVIEGMIMAAGPEGTSVHTFDDYPYTVAAKTGTPETKQFPNSTYICFAPAEDPQIAIVVVIEKGWHGYTGAPVAKKVMDQYFFGSSENRGDGRKFRFLQRQPGGVFLSGIFFPAHGGNFRTVKKNIG